MDKKAYALRIARATQVQLVIITHELLLEFLKEAEERRANGDADGFFSASKKAARALQELINGLDFKQEIALNLYDLYVYANGELCRAQFSLEAPLEHISEIFKELKEAWEHIEDKDLEKDKKNAPSVTAGMTYDKHGLTEITESSTDFLA